MSQATDSRTDAPAPVAHLTAEASSDELTALLRRDGCAVVDALAGPALLDRFTDELRPYLDATALGRDDFTGRNTKRTGALIARCPSFHALAAHPLVLPSIGAVLAPWARTFQLHLSQVIAIGPHSPAQMIHRDQWAYEGFSFPDEMECAVHVMWALTDFTEANGATRVIPGSHHWPDMRPGKVATGAELGKANDEQFSDANLNALATSAAEMQRGSALLYTGSVYHGGGPNDTDEWRLGINVGYNLSWLRQEENQYLACPPAAAKELPESLARLIGYAAGGYALGYYGDTRDAYQAVRDA